MPSTARDDRLLSSSHLCIPGVLAFCLGIIAFVCLFGASYGLNSFGCPVLFMSNLAEKFLSRSLFTYFITITAIMYGITMFIHYIDVKLRIKWDIVEGELDNYTSLNNISIFCGIISMFGFIGITSFPYRGIPVVQSLYFTNNSNDTNSIIFSSVNIVHMINVGFGYVGFFLYAWSVFLLNIRTRVSYSSSCSLLFLAFQSFILILFTIFSNVTVISMIIMSIFYEIQPESISKIFPECFNDSSIAYYAHMAAILSQFITTASILLYCLTLLPPLKKKILFISLEELTIYSLGSNLTTDAESFSPPHMNGDIKPLSGSRRERLSESSDVLFGNTYTNSQSNSVFDLYKETIL
ncbi:hypothetical protein LOD99_4899 [Oopsacas minuta]|uniref:Uncharacterized protein n=1 Tax=Oopsacas minuta TaxID=111878 RepID=A0AAV7JRX3_9METZ|nr:hypothetical protein LOD99_4899 [Oopsacas minuta]